MVARMDVPVDLDAVQLDGLLLQPGRCRPDALHTGELRHRPDECAATVRLEVQHDEITGPGIGSAVAEPLLPAHDVARHGGVGRSDEHGIGGESEPRLDVLNLRHAELDHRSAERHATVADTSYEAVSTRLCERIVRVQHGGSIAQRHLLRRPMSAALPW